MLSLVVMSSVLLAISLLLFVNWLDALKCYQGRDSVGVTPANPVMDCPVSSFNPVHRF